MKASFNTAHGNQLHLHMLKICFFNTESQIYLLMQV